MTLAPEIILQRFGGLPGFRSVLLSLDFNVRTVQRNLRSLEKILDINRQYRNKVESGQITLTSLYSELYEKLAA